MSLISVLRVKCTFTRHQVGCLFKVSGHCAAFSKQIFDSCLVVTIWERFTPQRNGKSITVALVELSQDALVLVVAGVLLKFGAFLEVLSHWVVDFFF